MDAFQKLVLAFQAGQETEQIHSTVGVYLNPNVPFKYNGVRASNLQEHIEYNKLWRFGRALFVDGKCVYKGYLSDERVAEVEAYFVENPHRPTKDSAPYH